MWTDLTVSILVVGKSPWFIFQVLMSFHCEVLSCYKCRQHQWSSSTLQKVWHWTSISSEGTTFVHHLQPLLHNSYSKQCVSSVYQNHTNLSAHFYTTFKVWFGREASTMLPQLVTLVNIIHVLMIFGHVFNPDNLLGIPASPPGNLHYSSLP